MTILLLRLWQAGDFHGVADQADGLGGGTSTETVEKVVAELQKAGHLTIDEKGTVSYKL